MPNWSHGGSGTLGTDLDRERLANNAEQVLSAGKSILCKSGDHLNGSETCTAVIVRLQGSTLLCGSGESLERRQVPDAVHNLRAGNGHHAVQANHAGGNTCAQVIAGTRNA